MRVARPPLLLAGLVLMLVMEPVMAVAPPRPMKPHRPQRPQGPSFEHDVVRFIHERPSVVYEVAACVRWAFADDGEEAKNDAEGRCDVGKMILLPLVFASKVMGWEKERRTAFRAAPPVPGGPAHGAVHGSRPAAPAPFSDVVKSPSIFDDTDRSITLLTLLILGGATLASAFYIGQVSKPYQPEFEVEKMYRKFHSFASFWSAVSKQPTPNRERWVGTLCLVAGVLDPPLLEGNGPAQPALAAPQVAAAVDLNDTFAGASAELEAAAGLGAQATALLQLETTHGRHGPSKLRQRAIRCYEALKDMVVDERDMRSYRMMIKRSFKTLAFMMLITGCLFTMFGLVQFMIVEPICDMSGAAVNPHIPAGSISMAGETARCMNDFEGMQVCKVSCTEAPYARENKIGFYMCYHDKFADFGDWVPIIPCPTRWNATIL